MTRLALCTVAALALIAIPSHGAERPATKPVAVSYADLDLSKTTGAETLLRRIKWAAGTACGPEPVIRDLDGSRQYDACMEQAVTTAVDAVGSPMLTALYGKAPPTSVATR